MRLLPLLSFLLFAALSAHAVNKPNVLLICVDDLKPVIGSYGDPLAKTPNLDRLAKRSVQFNRAYCNQAVCSPSRNSLMTSLRPQTLGIYDLPTNFRKAAPDAVTLAQTFRKAGYTTEAMGKIFHVGHGNTDDAASWTVPHWNGKASSYALPENKAPQEEANNKNSGPKKPSWQMPRGAAYESADVSDETYADGLIAVEAARRLKAVGNKGADPFFMAVGFLKPHLPFCAPKKYWDMYDRAVFSLPKVLTPPAGAPEWAPQPGGELRQYAGIPASGALPEALQISLIHGYYAATSYMDAQLGRVLDALDESGLSQNTVIVLWGDHGWHLGDHGIWCKHTNYEQAARIPLMIAAPESLKGVKTDALVETVDIYPTLCELAGLQLPAGLDGRSFASVIRGKSPIARDSIIHVYPRGNRLGRAIRDSRYRLVEWKTFGATDDSVFELYDYETDPEEKQNIADKNPEVLAALKNILAKHPAAKPQWKAAKP